MARMPILRRIARHTLPATTADTILDFPPDQHLIWTGAFKPRLPRPAKVKDLPPLTRYGRPRTLRTSAINPVPYLNGPNTNPARILFDYPNDLDPFVRLVNDCGNPACINPKHYKPKATFSGLLGRAGHLPEKYRTTFDEQAVKEILELLDAGESPEDMKSMSNPLDFAEALKRREPVT